MENFGNSRQQDFPTPKCKRCGHELTWCPRCGDFNFETRWQDLEVLIKDLKQALFTILKKNKGSKTCKQN